MTDIRRLYRPALALTALVFVFLILISAASSAEVTRIGNGSDPAIHGSKVVWTDDGIIHVYDLMNKTDATVDSSAASYPAIHDNKLVWHDESSEAPRLAVYDISTAAKTYITQDVDQYSKPAIYGDRIVWSANDSVYLRDMSTSTQTKIGDGSDPDIYDTKVVYFSYTEEPEMDMAIRMYDINTKEKITVSSYGYPNIPHIWGTKVIWSDVYNHQGYIAMYDTSTKNIIDVTHQLDTDPYGNEYGASTGTHIAIHNDKIVYHKSSDDYEGKPGVYVYNISTGQSTLIYDYPEEIFATPEVYNNTVVWGTYSYDDGVTSYNGVYVSDLSATDTFPPVAEFTSNVTSGAAPLVVLFNDASNGGSPASWLWDFGDGTDSKHEMNATHTFKNPGVYTISLTVTNGAGSSNAIKGDYIIVTETGGAAGKPAADFYSPEAERVLNGTSDNGIFENDVVSFFDNSTGSPTSWFWDFGDGNTSTERSPTHMYGKIGGYIVSLTVGNEAGSDTISKYGYVLMGIKDEPATPAYFSSDVTFGNAPLTVTFVDDKDAEFPNYPIWREWDFGDGVVQTYVVDNNDSATPYATHVYEKPGKYTVTLSLDNRGGKSIITKYNYITVTDPTIEVPEIPVADFSSNVTGGYAPLAVQFNDLSRNAASRVWDFNNDGKADSSEQDPIYVYASPGTYFVNLTVTNPNGISWKIITINVLENGSGGNAGSSGDSTASSGSSSKGGSSSGGGGGGSPEPAKNVEVKELCQVFITNGKEAKFDFTKDATCVVSVSFDAKKTLGKTTTIAEMLKEKSSLVSELPSGEVYKSFNVWVGNGGVANSKNIENAVVCFKVEKEWIQDKKIDRDSIVLNTYCDKKWEQLPVSLSGEDDTYLYFTAETPGFASFAITGEAKSADKGTETGIKFESETRAVYESDTENKGSEAESRTGSEKSMSMPGFEIVYGLAGLLAVFLYRRR